MASPTSHTWPSTLRSPRVAVWDCRRCPSLRRSRPSRSEEHTSELQSQFHLVCRPLPEKKNTISLNSIVPHPATCGNTYILHHFPPQVSLIITLAALTHNNFYSSINPNSTTQWQTRAPN